MGGSQGARSINLAAIEAFAEGARRATSTSSTSPAVATTRSWSSAWRLPRTPTATRCSPTSPTSATCSPPATWSWPARAARSSRSPQRVGRRSSSPIRTPPPTTRAPTPPGWPGRGRPSVIEDEALERTSCWPTRVGALLGDEERLAAMAAASRRPGPARRGAADRRRGPGGGPVSRHWSARRDCVRAARLHFIGIGGAGMSGLALVCAELGATVTGSDRAESSYMERLRAAGLEPAIGHDAANLPEGAEVVVSTAIGEDNPELALARERGIEPIAPRRPAGRALRREAPDRRRRHPRQDDDDRDAGLGAARAGRRPGLLRRRRGAGPRPGRRGASTPAGGRASGSVAEADESDASFLELKPEIAVVTNVEMDHHSRWGSLAELREAFAEFAAGRGRWLAQPEAPSSVELELRRGPGRAQPPQRARRDRRRCGLAGFDVELVAEALADFPGVRPAPRAEGHARRGSHLRRLRPPPDRGARGALGAARARAERLVAVFQPHLYSRTKAFGEQFGAALALADEVVRPRRLPGSRGAGRRAGRGQRPAGRRRPRPIASGAGGSGGCRRPRRPGRRLGSAARARRRPGHDRRRRRLQARRGAGRGGRRGAPSPAEGVRARLPAGPADHGSHRRCRRLVCPARDRGASCSSCWPGRASEGLRARGGRLGLQPAGRRRGLPRPGDQARRRAGDDRARGRAARSAAAAPGCPRRRRRRRAGASPGSSSASTSPAPSAAR